MGIIDDNAGFGTQSAGTVRKIGSNNAGHGLRIGDRVVVLSPGQGIRTLLRAPAAQCTPLPDGLDHVQATSFPSVLLTAYYSLVHVGRLRAGEFCLIHSAAGGVGQMAVQVALRQGARVMATVSSREKRVLLRDRFGLADDMIFHSRDTTFVEGVMRATGGRGYDVALNSLAGPLLDATWMCVASHGRLIEIGKRDIHENRRLDMQPFRRNATYTAVDLLTAFDGREEFRAQMLSTCFELVSSGQVLPPAPIRTFSYGEVQRAFREMQRGKSPGRVVLVPVDENIAILPPLFRHELLFTSEKYYLLCGGLGGIGRRLAEWMFWKGARKFAFLSRSADSGQPQVRDTLGWLASKGAALLVRRGDVTSKVDVADCVRAIRACGTLGGVFHAAMVLRDGMYAHMTLDDWHACVLPKARGAYNLHEATLGCDGLDFFVCFSSVSAVAGPPGQANYAAANCYLDALMCHRRERGLPGSTMNLGAVADMGVVAEDEALAETMARLGTDQLAEDEVWAQVEVAVRAGSKMPEGVEQHRTLTGMDLPRKALERMAKPLLRNLHLYASSAADGSAAVRGHQSLAKQLQTAPLADRTALLLASFITQLATVAATPASDIDSANDLSHYGLDSLVAIELRSWFDQVAGVDVPLFDITHAKSIRSLVKKASNAVHGSAAPATPAAGATANTPVSLQSDEVAEIKQRLVEPAVIPLTPFQRQKWNLHHALGDSSRLNRVHLLRHRINEVVPDPAVLEQAFSQLVLRNDILRTAYSAREGQPEQRILQGVPAPVRFAQLQHDPCPESALQDFVSKMKEEAFNLTRGEVVRLAHVRLSDQEYALVLVNHQIAMDARAYTSFIKQLIALSIAISKGKSTMSVPAPKLSHLDFTLWQQRLLASPGILKDLEWWKHYLFNAPLSSPSLPFAKAAYPQKPTVIIANQTATLTRPQLMRIRRLSAHIKTAPFAFVFAAWKAFLYFYINEPDVVVLAFDGRRPHPAFDDTIGYFVNYLPIRCQVPRNICFDRLISLIKVAMDKAFMHSSVPFQMIVDHCTPPTEGSRAAHPFFQISVNYVIAEKPLDLDFDYSEWRITHELALECIENRDEDLQLRLIFNDLLYDPEDMAGFWAKFHKFLCALIIDYRQPLVDAFAVASL
ncbi:Beta-ketoacyl synthase [Macrophomina phaseolina MS6]|uniref:Beta-ketoacyl synthase n=1 Tax=Macrophomina phaseolina (strain MS6) TaxID=1126212 RepID=K2QH32_MACPH|nr:Beta-ketoacyl synthase [Macrophomina phaseolina MS6]